MMWPYLPVKPPPMAPGIAPDGTFPGVILMPDPRPIARGVPDRPA